MGRQEEEVDAFGDDEFFAGMPASLIEDQQDALRRACANGLGELCQGNREHIRPHRWQEHPFRLSGSWLHKTGEVEPQEAMLDSDTRPGPFAYPDPAQNRLESDTVLIGRPYLNCGLGKRLLDRFHLLGKVFLKASWAAGSALVWRGRSTRLEELSRLRYSQPRWGWTWRPVWLSIQWATLGPVHKPPSSGGSSRAC